MNNTEKIHTEKIHTTPGEADVGSRHRRALRLPLAVLLVAGSVLGSAAWAPEAGATPVATTENVLRGCSYQLPLYTSEGQYLRFYTYSTSERVWRRSNWYYVRGFTQYEYTTSGWETRASAHFVTNQMGTVYVYVKTYSASRGWEGSRLGRCIDGLPYSGW